MFKFYDAADNGKAVRAGQADTFLKSFQAASPADQPNGSHVSFLSELRIVCPGQRDGFVCDGQFMRAPPEGLPEYHVAVAERPSRQRNLHLQIQLSLRGGKTVQNDAAVISGEAFTAVTAPVVGPDRGNQAAL